MGITKIKIVCGGQHDRMFDNIKELIFRHDYDTMAIFLKRRYLSEIYARTFIYKMT